MGLLDRLLRTSNYHLLFLNTCHIATTEIVAIVDVDAAIEIVAGVVVDGTTMAIVIVDFTNAHCMPS